MGLGQADILGTPQLAGSYRSGDGALYTGAGPTGVGVLWGRPEILDAMDPFVGGGEMIREVHLDHSTWNDLPYKFEAGTMNIAQAVGLGAAVDYLDALGMENVREHERRLGEYAYRRLSEIGDITI